MAVPRTMAVSRAVCASVLLIVIVSSDVLCGSMSEQAPPPSPVPLAGASIGSPIDCPANHTRDGGVSVVEPILLISTLDGRLFAVGQKSGMIKWSLSFGSPIVNMYQVDESGVIQTKRVPLNSAFGSSGKDLLSSLYLWQSDDRKDGHRPLTPAISGSSRTTIPLLEGPDKKGSLQSHCTRKKWFELIISGKKVEPEPLIPSLSQFHRDNFLPSSGMAMDPYGVLKDPYGVLKDPYGVLKDPYALMRGEDENPEVGDSIKKMILIIGTVFTTAAAIIMYKLGLGPFKTSGTLLAEHVTLMDDHVTLMNDHVTLIGNGHVTQIGKIQFDTRQIIGRGSAGTCVYKGLFEGKNPVAVKRIITEHFTLADREIELLRKVHHPNLVRYYATESDTLFRYIAIELAEISLADYIEGRTVSERDGRKRILQSGGRKEASETEVGKEVLETEVREKIPETEVREKIPETEVREKIPETEVREKIPETEVGKEIPENEVRLDEIEILHDSCQGLCHLHSVNVIHRDIKPQNILISAPHPVTGKRKVLISDFGVSKTIHSASGDSLDPFLSTTTVMKGTDGWIAPEVLLSKMSPSSDTMNVQNDVKRSKQIDVFSMGCLFYYVFSHGKHPFGDSLERQSNIIRNIHDLSDLEDEENVGKLALIKSMIAPDPNDRPSISTVLNYPLFWSKSKQLQFLQDVSDRIEKEEYSRSEILKKIERERWAVTGDDWTRRLPLLLQIEMNNHRSYNTKWLSHLIRMIRNKRHHYRELPQEVQSILGPIPDSFMTYFTDQFPRLVYHVYIAIQEYRNEPMFHQYYDQDSRWDFSFQKLPVDPAKFMASSSPNSRRCGKKKSHGKKKKLTHTNTLLPPNDFSPNFQSKENRTPFSTLQQTPVDEGTESDVSSEGEEMESISLKPNGMVMSNFISPSQKNSNFNSWNCTQASATNSPSHGTKLK